MQPLSVVIITFNEERNIGRCLESINAVANDIVIIDSYSTDTTKKICERYPVKFIERAWEGYSSAKNFGNTAARYDWILSIDADEALSPELQKSIIALKGEPGFVPCSFARLNNYCGTWIRHGGWYPDVKTRIFNRHTTRWEGTIHETLAGIDKTTVRKLDGSCFHYTYYTIAEHWLQAKKFGRMASESRLRNGSQASCIKSSINPAVKFLRDYVFRGGFLDGRHGLTIAIISAWMTHLKYRTPYRKKTLDTTP